MQRAVSARMDGEPRDVRAPLDLEEHLAACERCYAFAASAGRVRAAVRIGPADPVPDLVSSIVGALEREGRSMAPAPAHARAPRRLHERAGARWQRTLPVAAALVAGAIVGSVLVGGPFRGADRGAISANAVVLGVRAAAPALESFDGTFDVVERGFSTEVPERRLDVRMAFLAPQRFRLDVVDRTTYPARVAASASSDLTFIQNGATTFRSGPSGCPSGLDIMCPETSTRLTSGATPTDLMVPVATLGSARGGDVLGTARIEGAQVVRLRLTFSRAQAMFPFLWIDDLAGMGAASSAGTWRPFFPGDRVEVELDAESWVPRRITVYPASSERRRAWELRFGLPVEAATMPILDVVATGIAAGAPDASLFEIPSGHAPPLTLAELAETIGRPPATPTFTGELRLETSVAPVPASDQASFDSLLVYADGLDHLRVSERAGPHAELVGRGATPIALSGGGVGYYSEATATRGRRITIVASDRTLLLESNLPTPQLMEIAASIPVQGRPLP
ncbi:MAG TPA: hypothetical protein VNC60_09350 [Actinomycetota bacterium]|nr:hypothetical protein [Actinomycetota bacterium]